MICTHAMCPGCVMLCSMLCPSVVLVAAGNKLLLLLVHPSAQSSQEHPKLLNNTVTQLQLDFSGAILAQRTRFRAVGHSERPALLKLHGQVLVQGSSLGRQFVTAENLEFLN